MEDPTQLLNWHLATWVAGPHAFQSKAASILEAQLKRIVAGNGSVKRPTKDAPPLTMDPGVAPGMEFVGRSRVIASRDTMWTRTTLGSMLQKCMEGFSHWPAEGLVVASAWCQTIPTQVTDAHALALHKNFAEGGMEISTVDGFRVALNREQRRRVVGWSDEDIRKAFSEPGMDAQADRISLKVLHEKTHGWLVEHPLRNVWRQAFLDQSVPNLTSPAVLKPRF